MGLPTVQARLIKIQINLPNTQPFRLNSHIAQNKAKFQVASAPSTYKCAKRCTLFDDLLIGPAVLPTKIIVSSS
jgi:hypothetical protein